MDPSILTTITPQYIIDSHGKRTGVVLDVKSFNSIIEELEDLYDILQAEKILAKGKVEEGKTIEEIEGSIHGEK